MPAGSAPCQFPTRQGQSREATAAFELALTAYNQLLRRDPSDLQFRFFSVVPLWRLGQNIDCPRLSNYISPDRWFERGAKKLFTFTNQLRSLGASIG
jgi:hypothetical protein